MSIKQAEIKKMASLYHGGSVSSRTVITAGGEMKSLGIMLPGVYRFSTDAGQRIEITQGQCRVKLADRQEWDEYVAGDGFEVPANSHYEIEVIDVLDYVCHYGPEAHD
ncbi:MAG: pyrimidine/purine nucleoside phosphorylase [Gammaproteobacteria bacterium]|nr:pyrimidine/purine nucleoside phosphorylase [Gammaproteobacteria bacterium]NIR99074.1 pyrimidine/purine nucleoside phosphorylase [Gammaproteobacteria bacterium]NIT64706.1 pyrimidine/purine nucleoside phosphorylase [Gammaproteobacteria bacterium]NIV21664.1 DUF1255 family protein [Gammaproteobacteria bacterium]NIX10626.1 DUF1255 family protein [Gammaproteobacteria bacterium]